MTSTQIGHEPAASPYPAYPARFRGAPERGARIGRTLRVIARVRRVDEDLIDLIGRRMLERDEVGASLVRAIRAGGAARPDAAAGTERVTMAQFRRALEDGIESVPDAPEPLRRFFGAVDEVPAWVDFGMLDRGARAIQRMGRVANDVLLYLSLIGGYRFGGPADLLVLTGGLSQATALRRLGETETWAAAVITPGGMRRQEDGFKLTVHVRLMHALLNDRFEKSDDWDSARWGLPVSQADLAGTLALFASTLLLGVRVLGWWVGPRDALAVMHLWKYVGWLLGVDEDWLFDTERDQYVFSYHLLLCQDGQTPAGAALAAALVNRDPRPEPGLPGLPGVIGARYERLRALGMLRYLLGAESVRDLGLPLRLPWAIPPVIAGNAMLSVVVARFGPGRRYLLRRSARFRRKRVRLLFGEGARAEVGALPL